MICKHCGKEFQAERSTAQYCSDICRVAFNRGLSVTGSPDISVTSSPDVTVRPVSVTAPSGRIRPVCQLCPVCLYPDWKGELMYPEDSAGVPYCNSEGPLSDTNRAILSRPYTELKYVKAAQTGPYA